MKNKIFIVYGRDPYAHELDFPVEGFNGKVFAAFESPAAAKHYKETLGKQPGCWSYWVTQVVLQKS